jgi:hypothetical protein
MASPLVVRISRLGKGPILEIAGKRDFNGSPWAGWSRRLAEVVDFTLEKPMKRMEVLTLAVALIAAWVEIRNRRKAWKQRKALKLTAIPPVSGA